jgi:hypothetical protein
MTIRRGCPEGCLLMTVRLSFPFFSYKLNFACAASDFLSFYRRSQGRVPALFLSQGVKRSAMTGIWQHMLHTNLKEKVYLKDTDFERRAMFNLFKA